MPGKRKNWVDSLRALAMILVVVGHTSTAENTYFALTAAVKMPLFFAVSGYLLRENETRSPFEYARDRFMRLMAPYFALSIVSIPIIMAFHIHSGEKPMDSLLWNLKTILRGDLVWYLPCLFLNELIVYAIRHIRTIVPRMLTFAAATAVGALLLRPGNPLPWRPEAALFMLPFTLLGRAFARRKEDSPFSWGAIGVLGALSAALLFIQIRINRFQIDVNNDVYASLPLNMITGLTCVAFLFMLFPRLPDSRAMLWIGRNTLVIYLFHDYPVVAICKIASRLSLPDPSDFLPLALVISAISIALCFIPATLIDRFCPWMAGKRRKTNGTGA